MRSQIIWLSLGVGLLLSYLAAEAGPVSLAALCGDKLQLRNVAELEELDKQLGAAGGAGCPPHVAQAIKEMAAIVRDKRACRMDKVEAVVKFVHEHVKQSAQAIPKALANFAVAYGMQLAKVCSREMVETFPKTAEALLYNKLGPEEYAEFEKFKVYLVDVSPIGLVLSPLLKAGELILPGDLLRITPAVKLSSDVKLPESEQLVNFRGYCDDLLRPLYEPTLLPMAHLNRAGFSFKSKNWHSSLKRDSHFWAAVVYLCESYNLKVPKALRRIGHISSDSDSTSSSPSDQSEHTQLVASTPMKLYESSELVGDEIIGESWLKKQLESYDANVDELDRLKEKFNRRGLRIMMAMLRRANYRPALLKLIKLVKAKEGTDKEKFEEVRSTVGGLLEAPDAELSITKLLRAQKKGTGAQEKKGFIGTFLFILFLLAVFFLVCILDASNGRNRVVVNNWDF